MRTKFKITWGKHWGISKGQYYHCPIIYFAFGQNGLH